MADENGLELDQRTITDVKTEQDNLTLQFSKLLEKYLKAKLNIEEAVTAGRMELARARFLSGETNAAVLRNATIGNPSDQGAKMAKFLARNGVENYKKARDSFQAAIQHCVVVDNLDKEMQAVSVKLVNNNKRIRAVEGKNYEIEM